MGIPDHLTCLLRNLHAGQEATVRTGHGTTDWYQIGKGVHQGCILLPCLFNLCAEYITRNARLEELKSLLMKEKEESEKTGLKLNIQKTNIMTSGSIQFSSVAQSWGLPILANSYYLFWVIWRVLHLELQHVASVFTSLYVIGTYRDLVFLSVK